MVRLFAKKSGHEHYPKEERYHADWATGAYADDRFDMGTIKLDWVLSYPRTQAGFNKLQKSGYLNAGTAESLVNAVSVPRPQAN